MTEPKYIENQFKWLEREISIIRHAIEELAKSSISAKEFDNLAGRTSNLDMRLDDTQTRLDKCESDIAVIRRAGLFVLGIVGAVFTAWLRGFVGL